MKSTIQDWTSDEPDNWERGVFCGYAVVSGSGAMARSVEQSSSSSRDTPHSIQALRSCSDSDITVAQADLPYLRNSPFKSDNILTYSSTLEAEQTCMHSLAPGKLVKHGSTSESSFDRDLTAMQDLYNKQ